MASPKLTASYASPSSAPFTITHTIPTPPSTSVPNKTSYLSTLRAAVRSTQAEINKELTSRMDADKARDAASKLGIDEVKEEDNYGEEIVEED
ncbi:hypothetical protein G7046_g8435 [Stylonectria norvegica]|nr:hypothetical protein G7046_g8435 [Stylonectria norvegica]